MNDPARCREKGIGPIPPGLYEIGPAHAKDATECTVDKPGDHHPRTGPLSMRLTPAVGTDTFGRSGLLVHGPNRTPDPTDDSEGCPIMPRGPRALLALSPDRLVEVVAERPVSVPVDPVLVVALVAELEREENPTPTEIA
jgi:hypothetical protein